MATTESIKGNERHNTELKNMKNFRVIVPRKRFLIVMK